MTNITFLIQGNLLLGFECSGHAGFAKKGEDIVCAAISSQSTTCINALETIANVKPIVQLNEKKAFLKATLPQNIEQEKMHDCQIILKVFQQGMQDLHQQYPNYITLGGKLC